MRTFFLIALATFLGACAQSRRVPFTPSMHGFGFVNSFEGDPLPEFLQDSPIGNLLQLGMKAGAIRIPNRFGLCGGMSAAATDYWLASKPVPNQTNPPKPDDALYGYLKRRQADSLGSGGVMALKFIDWMMLEERGPGRCTAALTPAEVEAIRVRIAEDGFAHVGLVYVDRTGVPWQNHQVLAYAARTESDRVIFSVYDPNFPKRDDIEVDVRLETKATGRQLAEVTQCSKDRKRHVRGMFLMPYVEAMPP